MSTARVRMIAGPNGSGKTTLLKSLTGKFNFHYFLNPDAIESGLTRNGELDFSKWGLKVDQRRLLTFLRRHPLKQGLELSTVAVQHNVLQVARRPGEYFTAALCDFMRRGWLDGGQSFTFETVMSSRDKVDFLRKARRSGYRTYLYYVVRRVR